MKLFNLHAHRAVQSESEFCIRNLTIKEARMTSESCSIGIHPCEINEKELNEQFKSIHFVGEFRHVVALGESGLDRLGDQDIEIQMRVFKRMITISELLKKPLIVHCVKAFDELLMMKKRYQPRQNWIIHGFRGKPEQAKQMIDHGIFLSFGFNYNVETLKGTPLNCFFIETDTSDILIEDVYRKIANDLNVDLIYLAEVMRINANNILNLKI